MKQLILSLLLFVSTATNSIGKDEINELSDEELKKKFISVIKDVEVEKIVGNSTELQNCLKKNKFEKNSNGNSIDENKAKEAERCFKEALSKKNSEELKNLSSKLGLQAFGLVPSNNVKEISDYLGDKMYKTMTGIDRKDQQNKEQLKFKNRKLINQKIFIQLYTTQLGKSALYEISRFCFENLRIENKPVSGKSFSEYWGGALGQDERPITQKVVDTGKGGEWGTITNPTGDKSKIYEDIFKGIGQNFDPKGMGNFFNFCSGNVNSLCKQFEDSLGPQSGASKSTSSGEMQTGANACLTKSRLKDIRKAINDSEAIRKQFETDYSGGIEVSVDERAEKPVFFDNENSNDKSSIDDLTTATSLDLLEGGKNKENEKLAEDCSANPGNSECKNFLIVDDSRAKAEHTIDMKMRMKKEIEKAHISKMNENDLEKYLEERGYLDLAKKVKEGQKIDFEAEIEKIYEAKRLATLQALKNRIGRRQISEEEIKNENLTQENLIKENSTNATEERARLAQVLLFNNIITSQLKLTRKDTGKEVGRNVGGLRKELEQLNSSGVKVDGNLFQNLKSSIHDGGTLQRGDSIVGLELIDSVLSNKKEESRSTSPK